MTDVHREWLDRLGQLVVGGLDGPGRTELERHLESCSACRAEAEALMPMAEVLPLAAPDRSLDDDPPLDLAERIVRRIGQERTMRAVTRRRRWYRTAVSVAAAVVGAAAVVTLRPEPAAPPAVERVVFTSLPEGAQATAEITRSPGATRVELTLRGAPGGRYEMALQRADGSSVHADPFAAPAGSWHGVREIALRRTESVALRLVELDSGRAFVAPLDPADG